MTAPISQTAFRGPGDNLIGGVLARLHLADRLPLRASCRCRAHWDDPALDQLCINREVDLGTIELVDLGGLACEECAHAQVDLVIAPDAVLLVHGVAKLLRRTLRNLLENARRYGTSDIQVHVNNTTHGSQCFVQLSVCDRGPGVPPDLRERIFEPFYRLPGASEREGGVGLGLALVRSIVTRHGGQVRCEDREGGGARFVVELPSAQA